MKKMALQYELPPARPRPASPPPPPPAEYLPPRIQRYVPLGGGEQWQVDRFDLLVAEFALVVSSPATAAATLQRFHELASQHPRQWQVVRRLFGVLPLLPSAETHPEDMRVWERPELEADGFAVTEELAALRMLWGEHLKREEGAPVSNRPGLPPSRLASRLETGAPPSRLETGAPSRRLETGAPSRRLETGAPRPESNPETQVMALDDGCLAKHGFSERIFKIKVWDPTGGENGQGAEVPRPEAENRQERDWFVSRVLGWSKMLSDDIGGPVVRVALMNDLYLRRMESEIAIAPPQKKAALYDQKAALAKEYADAIKRIQEMFPDMAVASRLSFRAVISDLVQAHQDYYGRADRRLVDKVFTATEIEFQLRSSLQVGSRHRFTLSLAILENIHGLWDAEFRPQFKPGVFKKIETAVAAAREAAREATDEPMVDLERGVLPGEGDEFEDFNNVQCATCARWYKSSLPRCPFPHKS